MKNISNQNLDRIRASAAGYIEQLASGKDAREIAKEIYCTLPDKSDEVGYTMAEHFMTLVEEYHSQVDCALDNVDDYIDAQLQKAVEGKNTEDTCRAYHRMLLSLAAAGILAEAEPGDEKARLEAEQKARDYVAEHENVSFADATEEQCRSMAEQIKRALKEENVYAAQLPKLLLAVQDEDQDLVSIVPEYGRKSKELKLILATTAYVSAKKGELEDIDQNVSMREVTFVVCAALDTVALAGEVENGSMTEDEAARTLSVIGIVIGMVIGTVVIYFLATSCIIYLCSLLKITSVLGVLLIGLVSTSLLKDSFYDPIYDGIVKGTAAVTRFVGFALIKAAGMIRRGLAKLFARVYIENCGASLRQALSTLRTGRRQKDAQLQEDAPSAEAETESGQEPDREREPRTPVLA